MPMKKRPAKIMSELVAAVVRIAPRMTKSAPPRIDQRREKRSQQ
jgi:hypothetical protein